MTAFDFNTDRITGHLGEIFVWSAFRCSVWTDYPYRTRRVVPIGKLKPRIEERPKDNDWKKNFSPDSVYPPLILEIFAGKLRVLDGSHRVILFREWGIQYAPCWIVSRSKTMTEEKLEAVLKKYEIAAVEIGK